MKKKKHINITPNIKVPMPKIDIKPVFPKIKKELKLSIGMFNMLDLDVFYQLCRRLNVKVISRIDLGGLFNKKYLFELEANEVDFKALKEALKLFE